MEKKKNKKNKSEKEISEVKEKSETKQKKVKSVALSKEEKKAKKEKSASASETKAIEKASNEKDKKKISWNPFSKDNMYALKVWFQGLKSEFNKIIWPTKPQLLAYTVVVLATLISVSIYLFFLGKVFEFFFKQAGIV